MAHDCDAHGQVGRFRQRLQDDGPVVHGDHLVGLQAALGPGPRLPVAPHHAVFLEALDASFQLRGRLELQGRAGSDRHGQGESCRWLFSSSVSCLKSSGARDVGRDAWGCLPPHLDDDSVDLAGEPRHLRRRRHRLRRRPRPDRRGSADLRNGEGQARDDLQEGRAVRDRRRVQGRFAQGLAIRADLPVLRRQGGRRRVRRSQRRLRHDRRRHGPRPHRPRVRRRRLPRLPRERHERLRRPA